MKTEREWKREGKREREGVRKLEFWKAAYDTRIAKHIQEFVALEFLSQTKESERERVRIWKWGERERMREKK